MPIKHATVNEERDTIIESDSTSIKFLSKLAISWNDSKKESKKIFLSPF